MPIDPSCLPRRIARAALGCILALAPFAAGAQAYPAKSIRLVHGFATGAAIDVFSRPLAQKLAEQFGQQVVVDSRPGATGTIANEFVAKSAPDGYTLLAAPTSAITATPHLFKQRINPMTDLAPITQIGVFSFVLFAHPSVPVKTARDLVAAARARPGHFTYGSPGIGTGFHLGGELFAQMAGVKLLHVPYKGGGTTAVTDLVGGRVDLMWDHLGVVLPFYKAGRLKAIGVSGPRRALALPDVPTIAESGLPGYEIVGWHGLFVPAGTPAGVVDTLHAAMLKALAAADIRELWASFAMEIAPQRPEEFAARVRFDYERSGKLIRSIGVKVE